MIVFSRCHLDQLTVFLLQNNEHSFTPRGSILRRLRFLEELVPSFTLGVGRVFDFDPLRSRVVATLPMFRDESF